MVDHDLRRQLADGWNQRFQKRRTGEDLYVPAARRHPLGGGAEPGAGGLRCDVHVEQPDADADDAGTLHFVQRGSDVCSSITAMPRVVAGWLRSASSI